MGDSLHLTDEQFTEVLLGGESAFVHEHLANCEQCAANAARITTSIDDFKQQSRLWAERRAATHTALPSPRQRQHLWAGRPLAWTAATLAILFAGGTGIRIHMDRTSAASSGSAQAQASPPVSQTTLKADNDLLSAIDGELRVDDSASVSSYSLTANAQTSRKKTRRSVSE
jgi:anti-sigma factor RsiW